MQGRNVSWYKVLLVAASLLLVTPATSEDFTKEPSSITSNERSNAINTGQEKDKSADLESAETSYGNSYIPYNSIFSNYRLYTSSSPHILLTNYSSSRIPNSYGLNTNGLSSSCVDFTGPCTKSRYRSFDGSCNNLLYPMLGMANTPYGRLLPPIYADGIQAPTVAISRKQLPLSRRISFKLFPNVNVKDRRWSLAAMQWGQIIAHDMGLIAGTTQSKSHNTQCCTPDGRLLPINQMQPTCYPIIVPYDDPVYSSSGIQCLNFVRGMTDRDLGCADQYKPAEQLTMVTHYLDLSVVYGSSDQVMSSLRSRVAGRLRVDIRHNQEWPPPAMNKSGSCDTISNDEICYLAGDTRVNQNPQLTVLQIILLREHNRVATALSRLNPHWTDETLYQEARKIVIAEHQHISYYEWLPIFIGRQNALKNKILYQTDDYVNDYDPHIDPRVLNEHSNAAYRYFHSLIAGSLKLIDKYRLNFSYPLRLSDHFNKPGVIEEGNNMDDLTRGLSYQRQLASDRYFNEEITQYLFRNEKRLGSDLHATDIQRNRDHGLASYNDFREYCNIPRAKAWEDFMDLILYENIEKLASLYEQPDDVDLSVGGSLEQHVHGTLVGSTFLCILTEQFYRTRVGDRFWYETGDHELSFTKEQLNEIRKSSLSRLFCDNGDQITLMQPRGFEVVSNSNAIVSCDKLPSLNLSMWKDYALDKVTIKTTYQHPYFFYKK